MWSLTSGEKGGIHTVVTCASASGHVLSPVMIYPCKRSNEKLMKGRCSPWNIVLLSGQWMYIYSGLSSFYSRPVLLIEDGHGSHILLDVIKMARENHVHVLYLPSHCIHLLQPLDIGVFKSLRVTLIKHASTYHQ